MKETQRFSTAGSSASCCALLNLCTSSMNSSVCLPVRPSSPRAASIAARTCATPADTAEISTNRLLVTDAEHVGERGLAGPRRPPQQHRHRRGRARPACAAATRPRSASAARPPRPGSAAASAPRAARLPVAASSAASSNRLGPEPGRRSRPAPSSHSPATPARARAPGPVGRRVDARPPCAARQ